MFLATKNLQTSSNLNPKFSQNKSFREGVVAHGYIVMVFQIPNSYVGEPDPGQPSSVVLTQILQTEISGNGAQESVLFKELPRRLDVWPGLETTGSARLKCWAINAIKVLP